MRDQRFGLQDYRVTTGHVSLYLDLPWWNLTATVRGGRYLAGDWGGTVEIGRRFDSGIEVGAFREEAVARDWLNDVSRRFRTQFSSAQRDVQSANGWYRSRFTGMTQQSAEAACEALSERRVTCMVIRPG